MSDHGKRRGVTNQQWVEIREAHARGESDLSIAKRVGIHRNTIRNRREADGKRGDPWIVQPNVHLHTDAQVRAVQDRAQAKVIDMVTRQAVDELKASGAVQQIAEAVGDIELLYVELERASLMVAIDTMKRTLADGVRTDEKTGEIVRPLRAGTHTSEAGERKDAVTAAETAANLSRELRGKRPGTPSIGKDDDIEKADVIELYVDLPPTGTDGADPYGPES